MLAAATHLALAAPRQHRPLLARRSTAPVRKAPAALRCAASRRGDSAQDAPALPLPARLARSAAAAAVTALLLVGPMAVPPPASAELTTVTAQQATEMAKPLKKQKVNKNRIWGLFVLGATALFGSTVVLENNSAWFPAISKANRAMKQAREQAERREFEVAEEQAQFEERLALVQQERAADVALDAAVLEGMLEARKRSGSKAGPATALPAAAEAIETPAAEAEAAETPVAAPDVRAAADEAPAAAAETPSVADEAPAGLEGSAAAAAATAATAVMSDAAAAIEAEIAAAQPAALAAAAEGSGSTANGGSSSDDSSSGSAPAGEEGEVRKPLFEISGAQIEASSVDRLEQLQQEVERRKAAAAASAEASQTEGSSVDRLQQLEKEVERRKAAMAGGQADQ